MSVGGTTVRKWIWAVFLLSMAVGLVRTAAADIVPLWTDFYNGVRGGDDYGFKSAVDDQGNIYVAGQSCDPDTTGRCNMLTLKYARSGALIWEREYDGPGHVNDQARGVAVTPDGGVVVSGETDYDHGKLITCDFATVKYDADGNQLWDAHYGASEENSKMATVAVDADGDVTVAGLGLRR